MNKQEYESLKSGGKLKIVSLDYTAVGDANFEVGEVIEFLFHHESSTSNNDLLIKQEGGNRWYISHKDLEIVKDIEYKVGDEVVFIKYDDDTKWENMYGGFVGEKYKINQIVSKDSIHLETNKCMIFVVGVDQIKKAEGDEDSEIDDLPLSVLTQPLLNQSKDLEVIGAEEISGDLVNMSENYVTDTRDADLKKTPIKSDGGSSSYYFTKLPQHMIDKIVETGGIEIKDITRYVYDNDSDCKDITKALKRIQEWKKGGGKQGIDALYDANKIIFFAEELRESIKKDFGDKLNIL